MRGARSLALAVTLAATACDDGPPACDLTTPWPRHTITADSLIGADGVSLADIDRDGDLDVVSGFEQSERVTLSLHPDDVTACTAWPTVEMPVVVGAAEDAIFADVDHDGQLDVVSATESGLIHVFFPPADLDDLLDPAAWAAVEVTAATHLQRWMQLAYADLDGDGVDDLIAGGREDGATIAYFTTATPRDGTSYVYHPISPAGWTMSLVPDDVDGDGDIDVVVSDRSWIGGDPRRYDLIGSRWLENVVWGTWPSHTIYHPHDEGAPKFLQVEGNRVIDGTSSEGYNLTTLRTTTDWSTWTATPIAQPAGVGLYHDVEPGDVDGDGREDLVFSYSAADGPLIGVLALRAGADGSWIPEDISGPDGTKYDNIELVDLDGDGDLDAVTSEQIDELGVIWYENPRAPTE